MSQPRSPEATAPRRPGWYLIPWAILMTIGGYYALGGLWNFAVVAFRVSQDGPNGLLSMSPARRVEAVRVLLAHAAIMASGLLSCICAFRCRRGAWRQALYAAVLAIALWNSFDVLYPGL